jgi:hypothetical protein
MLPFQREICIMGPKFRRFGVPCPIFAYLATLPHKGTSLHHNARFESSTMEIGSVVRAVREPRKIVKKGEN